MNNHQLSIDNAQLPNECKQTEVGVIPKDWNVKSIGDIADVKTGPFGSALHEKDYVEDGTPIITVEHLGELGVEHINLPMVSDKDRNRLKAYSLRVGDIVFSRVGSIDRNAIIKKPEAGWLFSGRLLRVRLNNQENNSQYLSYHFHSDPFKHRVKEVAVGQTMPSLNTHLLKGVQIILPTEEEQRSIAQALSDVDALIAALEKTIAKKRSIKTATMQQLLTGRKRLPGFGERKGYQQTEIGAIPVDWNAVPLTECCTKITDGTHDTPKTVKSGVPYLTAIHVKPNHIDFDSCYFLPESTHSEIFKRCNPEQGDVLMVNIGAGVATTALVAVDYEFSLKNVALLKPNSQKLVGAYLNQSQLYRREPIVRSLLSGGAQPFLSLGQIGQIRIALPSNIEEQRSIATVLSNMDSEIAALEDRLAKTQAIKQGMMQELLTGRTRLV